MSTTWPLFPESKVTAEQVVIEWLGRNIQVHRDAVGAFRLVEARARRTRYGPWLESQHESGLAVTGCFNYRPSSSSSGGAVTWENHSEHAHGIACDCNYGPLNPKRTDGVLITDYDRFGFEDGKAWLGCWLTPPEGLDIFFRWGGAWTSSLRSAVEALKRNGQKIRDGSSDAHHFEIELSQQQCRAFDWDAEIAREGDDVDKEKVLAGVTRRAEKKGKPDADADADVRFGYDLADAILDKVPGQPGGVPEHEHKVAGTAK